MSLFSVKGNENDVVISTRVRFARNIKDYPFASVCDKQSAIEINDKVEEALKDCNFEKIDFYNLDDIQKRKYVEMHRVSPDFVKAKLPHILLQKPDEGLFVMVGEEDHIRLQCITDGLELNKAYEKACKIDDILSDRLNIAYDDNLGYLTHCPTNLGTGMRASVMMFLPGLSMYGMVNRIASDADKLGIAIRGMYGEGTESRGSLFQVSNRFTMGISEEDTIKKMNEVISQIIKLEKKQRQILISDNSDKLRDKLCRSYGIMKNAYMMSSSEFMTIYNDVRLGICLGIIPHKDVTHLDELMIKVQPGMILDTIGHMEDERARDIKRAQILREADI